jgi:hypothetical protein
LLNARYVSNFFHDASKHEDLRMMLT